MYQEILALMEVQEMNGLKKESKVRRRSFPSGQFVKLKIAKITLSGSCHIAAAIIATKVLLVPFKDIGHRYLLLKMHFLIQCLIVE